MLHSLSRSFAAVALVALVAGCGQTATSAKPTDRAAEPSAPAASEVPASAASEPTPGASPSAAAQITPQPSAAAGIKLVAVGDSIGFNSSEDCPGCTGF